MKTRRTLLAGGMRQSVSTPSCLIIFSSISSTIMVSMPASSKMALTSSFGSPNVSPTSLE